MQLWVGAQEDITRAFWWKTYSPPTYLLGHSGDRIITTDLMGMRGDLMVEEVSNSVPCDVEDSSTLLIAPLSATFLDKFIAGNAQPSDSTSIALEEVWRYRNHVNLDDMDFGDDGVFSTLHRVFGRRGIGAWKVRKSCPSLDDGTGAGGAGEQ